MVVMEILLLSKQQERMLEIQIHEVKWLNLTYS